MQTNTETKVRRPSKVEYLDERVRELRDKLQLASPAQLIADVRCPPEMAAALMTGRPELARLTPARALSEEEARDLYNLIGTLIASNYALQQHANDLALLVKNWSDAFVTLRSVGEQIRRFADFKTLEEEEEAES